MFGQKKSAQKNLPSKTQKVLVRPTGLEPVPIAGHAPQTCAYANSATIARCGFATIGIISDLGGVCQDDFPLFLKQLGKALPA